ncbi:hypothetical protein ACFLVX_01790, partial [Chloroflexota bacterium]
GNKKPEFYFPPTISEKGIRRRGVILCQLPPSLIHPSPQLEATGSSRSRYQVTVVDKEVAQVEDVNCTGIISPEWLKAVDIDHTLVLKHTPCCLCSAPDVCYYYHSEE